MPLRKLKIAIIWLAYAAFLTPFIIKPASFIFPFVFPKIIWFRIVVDLMLGCYVLLLAANWEKYRPRFSWVSVSVWLFLISWVISTGFGVDTYRSMWDGHERMLGLFTFFHYIVFFLILSSVVGEIRQWRQLCLGFLGVGNLILLISVFQKINPDFFYNNGGDRVSGTLGNPIYLGAFAFFLVCLGFWIAFSATKNWEKWFGYTSSLLGVLGIMFSGSRGPFLGFITAILVFAFVYALGNKKPLIRRVVFSIYGVLVLCAGLIFVFRTTPAVQSLPIIGRLATISLSGGTSATRLMAWEIAIEGWSERPLFGFGPNNFMYVFNAHFRPEFLELGGWGETWFDNAHNIILNTLTVQGIFGLLTYLFVFACALWVSYRAYKTKEFDINFLAFVAAFFAGHLVQNIFVFENVTSYLYFFFMLAMIVGLSRSKSSNPESKLIDKPTTPVWQATVVFGAIIIFLFITNIRVAQANNAGLKVLQSIMITAMPNGVTTVPEVLDNYKKMQSNNSPHIDDIRMDTGRMIDERLSAVMQKNGKDEAIKLFNLAYLEIKKNVALHPYDVRYHIQQAQLALNGARLTNNTQYVLDARVLMEDAIKKSPKRQQLYYILSISHMYLRNYPEAEKALQKTIDDNPRIAENWWRLAGVLLEEGKKDEAKKTFEKAEAMGVKFSDPSSAQLRQAVGLPAMTGGQK